MRITLGDLRYADFGITSQGAAISQVPARIIIKSWGGKLGITEGAGAAVQNGADDPAGALFHVRQDGSRFTLTKVAAGNPINLQAGDYFLYIPPAGKSGVITVVYELFDGDGNGTGDGQLPVEVVAGNDAPTDISIDGAETLAAIENIEEKKTLLDAATDANYAARWTDLRNALDELISLNIPTRSDLIDTSERGDETSDPKVIERFIDAVEGYLAFTDGAAAARVQAHSDYETGNNDAYDALLAAAKATKVAEVYTVIDGKITGGAGGRLSAVDAEASVLSRIQTLNAAKLALDSNITANATTDNLAQAIERFELVERFEAALNSLKAASHNIFGTGIIAAGSNLLADIDSFYDTGFAAGRTTFNTALTTAQTNLAGNSAVIKLVDAVADSFAALAVADANTLVARLRDFVDAVKALETGDGAGNVAQDLVNAAGELLKGVMNQDLSAVRTAYNTAFGDLLDAQAPDAPAALGTGEADTRQTQSPFTLSGPDGDRFIVRLVKVTDGDDGNPATTLDNTYQWRIELREGQAEPAGYVYQVTVTYMDAGGVARSESFVFVQGLNEGGFTLRPEGTANDDHDGEIKPLQPNEGGPTLIEDQDRGKDREPTGANDQVADNEVDIAGGLPVGGTWAGSGAISGATVAGPVTTTPAVTLTFATKDDDLAHATVGVNGRQITITLEVGSSAADIQAVLQAIFTADDDLQEVNADGHDLVRAQIARILDVENLVINVVAGDGEAGTTAIFAISPDGAAITITLAGENAAAEDAGNLNTTYGALDAPLQDRAREVTGVKETVEIGGGTITLPDGTEFAFDGGPVVLHEDDDGSGIIDADEKAAKTIYVFRSNDGNTVELRAADSDGIDLAALANGGSVFVIATVAVDGTVTPNRAAPQSWVLQNSLDRQAAEREDLDPGDGSSAAGSMQTRYHEYELAAKNDDNDNDQFRLTPKDSEPGVGKAAEVQNLLHVGRTTPDFDNGNEDTPEQAAPVLRVEMTRKTVETRLHVAKFEGFKHVRADGSAVPEGTDEHDASLFSYAARPPVSFVLDITGDADAPSSVAVVDGVITVTVAANATVADVVAFLNSNGFKANDAVADLIDAQNVRFEHQAGPAGGVTFRMDGAVHVISITSPEVLADLKTELDEESVDERLEQLNLDLGNRDADNLVKVGDEVVPVLPEPVTPVTIVFVLGNAFRAVADTNTNILTVTLDQRPEATDVAAERFIEGAQLRDALARLINIDGVQIVYATSVAADGEEPVAVLRVEGTTITISLPSITPPGPAPADRNIDQAVADALEVPNQALADLLAARNLDSADEAVAAKQTIGIGAGVIYLPSTNGEKDHTKLKITFEATDVFTFVDAEHAAFEAAKAAEGIPGKITAFLGLAGFAGLTEAQKALITNLQTAYTNLHERGADEAGVRVGAFEAAINALAAETDDTAAVRALDNDGITALVQSARAIHTAVTAADYGQVEADDRQDLTIYVSEDFDTDGNSTGWSAKAVVTPTGDTTLQQAIDAAAGRDGVTFYVIATYSAASNDVEMNGEGTDADVDSADSAVQKRLVYRFTETDEAPIKHVIPIRNRDDHGPEFQPFGVFAAATAGQKANDEGSPDFIGRATEVSEANRDADTAAATKGFAILATDADNATPEKLLPVVSRSEIITYEEGAADEDNDNHLVTVDRHTGEITFAAGAFNHETATRDDAGGKYFLIEVTATSRSTLSGAAGATKTQTKIFKIYVDQGNEAPTDITLSDDIVTAVATQVSDLIGSYTALVADTTNDGNVEAHFIAFTGHLTALEGALAQLKAAASGSADQALDALVAAAKALKAHVDNAPGTGDDAATWSQKLAWLNNPLYTYLKDAFDAGSDAATADRTGRMVVEAGWNGADDIAIGTIEVTDSDNDGLADPDQRQDFTFTVNGPLGDLFAVRPVSGVYTLFFTGTEADLARLAEYFGKTFTLDITARDSGAGNLPVTRKVVISYEAAQTTTLPRDEVADDDGNGPHVNQPAAPSQKLLSGQTKDVSGKHSAANSDDDPEITQTVGGVNEGATGSPADPVIIGALDYTGLPVGQSSAQGDYQVFDADGETESTSYAVLEFATGAGGALVRRFDENDRERQEFSDLTDAQKATSKPYLVLIGTAPDHETTPGVDIVIRHKLTKTQAGFSGQTGVEAQGIDLDGDGDMDGDDDFAYSGGAGSTRVVPLQREQVEVANAEVGVTGEIQFTIGAVILIVVKDENAEQAVSAAFSTPAAGSTITVTINSDRVDLLDLATAIHGLEPGQKGPLGAQEDSPASIAAAILAAGGPGSPIIPGAVTNADVASAMLTIADGVIYDTTGTMGEIAFTGGSFDYYDETGGVTTNGGRFGITIYVSQDEDGTWSAKAVATPSEAGAAALRAAIGEGIAFFVLGSVDPSDNSYTPGGNGVDGQNLAYRETESVKFTVPVRNTDDNKPEFPQEEAANPNIAGTDTGFRKLAADADIDDQPVKAGSYEIVIAGESWQITINTDANAAGYVIGAPGTNTLTINLPAGANQVENLIDLFQAAANPALADLLRLELTDLPEPPAPVAGADNFTGQHLVDKDGVGGGLTFAYDASVLAAQQLSVNTANRADLTLTANIGAGNIYTGNDGAATAVVNGGAVELVTHEVLSALPFEAVLFSIVVDQSDGSVKAVRLTAERPLGASEYLLGTFTITRDDGPLAGDASDDTFAVSEVTMHIGTAVNAGQRMVVAIPPLPDSGEGSIEATIKALLQPGVHYDDNEKSSDGGNSIIVREGLRLSRRRKKTPHRRPRPASLSPLIPLPRSQARASAPASGPRRPMPMATRCSMNLPPPPRPMTTTWLNW